MESNLIYTPSSTGALRQCEILSNVTQINPVSPQNKSDENVFEIIATIHPYSIVVSQDCDLDWDFYERQRESEDINQGKLLNSVLLCEVDTADRLRFNKSDIKDRVKNTGEWKKIARNDENSRYHFLQAIPSDCDFKNEGLPELTSDFKRIFSIEASYLYQQVNTNQVFRRAVLLSPYLEHFSTRFHCYHGRIALPLRHESN